MWGFEHVESKCGHVSMVLLGHNVQFGFGCILGQKMFLRWFPMYWAYLSFSVCVICASIIHGFFQNWLESLWLIWSLDVHLSTYMNFDWASPSYFSLWSLFMYVCRLRIAHVCVPVGIMLNQYGVV